MIALRPETNQTRHNHKGVVYLSRSCSATAIGRDYDDQLVVKHTWGNAIFLSNFIHLAKSREETGPELSGIPEN